MELWELVVLKTQKKRLGKSLEHAISSHITLLDNKTRIEIEWRGRGRTNTIGWWYIIGLFGQRPYIHIKPQLGQD